MNWPTEASAVAENLVATPRWWQKGTYNNQLKAATATTAMTATTATAATAATITGRQQMGIDNNWTKCDNGSGGGGGGGDGNGDGDDDGKSKGWKITTGSDDGIDIPRPGISLCLIYSPPKEYVITTNVKLFAFHAGV
jgi:hypothetical protein